MLLGENEIDLKLLYLLIQQIGVLDIFYKPTISNISA